MRKPTKNVVGVASLFLKKFVAGLPDVTPPDTTKSGFGALAYKVNSKLFILSKEEALVFKLPVQRVEELLHAGAGTPYQLGARPMKGWIVVRNPDNWRPLALESHRCIRRE